MAAGEAVDALEVHGVVGKLDVVDEVERGVGYEGVHASRFRAEAGDAIAALLGGAELELEKGLVACIYYAEIVGHCLGGGEGVIASYDMGKVVREMGRRSGSSFAILR